MLTNKKLWLYLSLIPIVLVIFTMGDTACFSSSSDALVMLGYLLFVSKWFLLIVLAKNAWLIIKQSKQNKE